jgi:hypothetical protein
MRIFEIADQRRCCCAEAAKGVGYLVEFGLSLINTMLELIGPHCRLPFATARMSMTAAKE